MEEELACGCLRRLECLNKLDRIFSDLVGDLNRCERIPERFTIRGGVEWQKDYLRLRLCDKFPEMEHVEESNGRVYDIDLNYFNSRLGS